MFLLFYVETTHALSLECVVSTTLVNFYALMHWCVSSRTGILHLNGLKTVKLTAMVRAITDNVFI